MEGWTLIDDAFVMSETSNFDPEMTSDYLNNLLPSLLDGTNDAETADVFLGIDMNTIHYNLSNTYTHPINQSFYDPNDLFTLEHTNIEASPVDWDSMMLSMLNESPSSTTLTGSNATTERSEYTSTYTTSPTSMAHSPTGPEPLQVSGNPPKQTIDDKVMKLGTRPCDIKSFRKARRKIDKPEICVYCQKGHQGKRELERHYRTNHPVEAEKMGISMARHECRYCGMDFARPDGRTRHLKNKHGGG
ncbi:hypothetical protein DER45DRAFT_542286 [Fusarium avenaceum]|nr:hypothetical protein DER45DRAFT_542286 [Fusarium avenaceum]